jgi:hypothetical protein
MFLPTIIRIQLPGDMVNVLGRIMLMILYSVNKTSTGDMTYGLLIGRLGSCMIRFRIHVCVGTTTGNEKLWLQWSLQ